MKLFQIALLLVNVIATPRTDNKATKPTPETFDVFWTKSRDERTKSQKKAEGPIENPKYERRSNFPLIDSVDELIAVTFDGLKPDPKTKPKRNEKKSFAKPSPDQVTFEGLADDLELQRNAMKALADPIIKEFNDEIKTKVAKDPKAVWDSELPLDLKITGDFSVTFTGLKLEILQKMMKMKFPKGVHPDRIWAQLRIVPDVKTRTEELENYFNSPAAHGSLYRTESAPGTESQKDVDASSFPNRAATDPTAN